MTTATDTQTGIDLLGRTALLLLEDGHRRAAALLRDVESWDTDYYDTYRRRVILEVPHWMVERFTDEVLEQITVAWGEVERDEDGSLEVVARRILPDPEGWRERIDKEIEDPSPTNQARLAPRPANVIQRDGLFFRSQPELVLYLVFQERQEELRTRNGGETFTVIPNAAIRIPDHTWEVDFLVCYRGRVGVFEIDGGRHRGKAADDRTRDQLLEDAGIAYVTRIPAESAQDQSELRGHVDRFLRKLRGD